MHTRKGECKMAQKRMNKRQQRLERQRRIKKKRRKRLAIILIEIVILAGVWNVCNGQNGHYNIK